MSNRNIPTIQPTISTTITNTNMPAIQPTLSIINTPSFNSAIITFANQNINIYYTLNLPPINNLCTIITRTIIT